MTTGLFGNEIMSATDTLIDTAWVKDRSLKTDFTLQLIVTDSAGCLDTFEVCFPIHEEPMLVPPDSTCVGAIGDTLVFCVEGACPASTYTSDIGLFPDDTLLFP